MTYVLTDGSGAIVTYPYNIGMLRRDNPNISFPANPTNELLAEWNVFPVPEQPRPSYDAITENVAEGQPTFDGTSWSQVWTVTPATPEEIAERTAQYQASAAAQGATLLAATEEYWNLAFEDGVALHPDFLAYRAALKDPSALPGYPAATQFPAFPTNIFDSSEELPIPVYTKTQADSTFVDNTTFDAAVGEIQADIAAKADTAYVDTQVATRATPADVEAAVAAVAGDGSINFVATFESSLN